MVKDSLSYGLYVAGNTLGEYSYDDDLKSFFRNVTGSYPLVFLHNEGTVTGFANQGPYEISRNVAGFGSMDLQFLGPGDRVTAGTDVPLAAMSSRLQHTITIFPNPTGSFFQVEGISEGCVASLTDLSGRQVRTAIIDGSWRVDVTGLPEGLYMVRITDTDTGHRYPAQRLIKY